MRSPLCFYAILLLAVTHAGGAASPAPPLAVPAFVDAVSFEFNADAESHKIVVITTPNLLRLDEVTDGYSVIYNPQTDYYTGLEHRNYTYWDFSWPEVRDAVENSKRHESRLQELGNEGLNGDSDISNPDTNAAPSSPPGGGDDSGYVWHPTTDRKRIADLDCVRWVGDTVSGENVEAWCYAGVLPKIQNAVDRLRTIDEPMALVPVRDIVPDFIFPIYTALLKGGVTPILINWGEDQNRNHFRFLGAKTQEGKLSLFTVPKLYVKTTLITMDGMIDSQPVHERKLETTPKTWQN
jgi:hypothetical protein